MSFDIEMLEQKIFLLRKFEMATIKTDIRTLKYFDLETFGRNNFDILLLILRPLQVVPPLSEASTLL